MVFTALTEIKRFNQQKLEELAQLQTEIYNKVNTKDPDFVPAKIEDVIKRFKKDKFDPNRMFYAYQGEKMIGYAGLTGKNVKMNLRGFGYPWILDDVDQKVRDLLYEAMEKQCLDEGTKNLEVQPIVFQTPQYQKRLDFFLHKQFIIKNEFLILEKQLNKTNLLFQRGINLGV